MAHRALHTAKRRKEREPLKISLAKIAIDPRERSLLRAGLDCRVARLRVGKLAYDDCETLKDELRHVSALKPSWQELRVRLRGANVTPIWNCINAHLVVPNVAVLSISGKHLTTSWSQNWSWRGFLDNNTQIKRVEVKSFSGCHISSRENLLQAIEQTVSAPNIESLMLDDLDLQRTKASLSIVPSSLRELQIIASAFLFSFLPSILTSSKNTLEKLTLDSFELAPSYMPCLHDPIEFRALKAINCDFTKDLVKWLLSCLQISRSTHVKVCLRLDQLKRVHKVLKVLKENPVETHLIQLECHLSDSDIKNIVQKWKDSWKGKCDKLKMEFKFLVAFESSDVTVESLRDELNQAAIDWPVTVRQEEDGDPSVLMVELK